MIAVCVPTLPYRKYYPHDKDVFLMHVSEPVWVNTYIIMLFISLWTKTQVLYGWLAVGYQGFIFLTWKTQVKHRPPLSHFMHERSITKADFLALNERIDCRFFSFLARHNVKKTKVEFLLRNY